MKQIITIIAAVVVIAIAGYFVSITRAPSAPSTDIQTAAESNESGAVATSQGEVYRISQTESKAGFEIGEILRDKPFTAVGTTSEVAGDISLKVDEESGHEYFDFGTITINARTFKTDSENRDGAIARMILRSEDPANEFITYKVTSVGLPDAPVPDVATAFSVTGDLTISGVTKQVTMLGTMTANSAKLSGNLSAKIKRSDFGLTIPNIPFVASVDDEFTIKADIVAYRIAE